MDTKINLLNVLRLILGVIVIAVLVDLVWDKVNIIPVTVYMPWWGFLITLVVVFMVMDVILTRALEVISGRKF
jgi:predicted MFS family arabinose efflux permease